MTNRLVDPLLLERPVSLERPEADDRSYAFRTGGSGKRRASSISALLVMLIAALVMVPVALADDDDDDGGGGGQTILVHTQPIAGACVPDNTPQVCDPKSPITFSGEADIVRFDVSPAHCSSIAVELFINGVGQGMSPFLFWAGEPGNPTFFVWNVDIDPGDILEIQATGRVGGCNVGVLSSWGGTVTIFDETGGDDDDDDDDGGDDDGDDDDDDDDDDGDDDG